MSNGLFRVNTRSLGEGIRRELQKEQEKARRAMNAAGGFLNGESKRRAPVDEGFLAGSISNRTVEYKNSSASVIYVPSNSPASDYAIAMHEGNYHPGEKSLQKQGKTGVFAGRKYITRAIDEHLDDVKNIIRSEMLMK